MAIRDEYIAVLRDELGEGFEVATFATLTKEYARRGLQGKVLARRRALLDNTALITARQSAEQALRDEEAARKTAEGDLVTQFEADLGTL